MAAIAGKGPAWVERNDLPAPGLQAGVDAALPCALFALGWICGSHAPKLSIPNKMRTARTDAVEAVDRHDASHPFLVSIVEAIVGVSSPLETALNSSARRRPRALSWYLPGPIRWRTFLHLADTCGGQKTLFSVYQASNMLALSRYGPR